MLYNATVNYQVLQQDKDSGDKTWPVYMRGVFAQVAFTDVKAYTEVAYKVAKEALKEAYDDVWGNQANQIADFLFGDTVKAILKENDTSFSNEMWKIMTWPAENMTISCPVDIFIYDETGTLCGSIENNTVTKTSTEFSLSVSGDVKYITGIRDGYRIVYQATGIGAMDIEIIEYTGYESPLRAVTFKAVPLVQSASYTQSIAGEVLTDIENYKLVSSGAGEELSPDDSVILLDLASVYNITTEARGSGTVTTDVSSAEAGQIVRAYTVASDGVVLEELRIEDARGSSVSYTPIEGGAYFAMPDADVHVVAIFSDAPVETPDLPSSGNGGTGGGGRFSISVADTAHGSISLDRETAAYGTVVTITVRPDAGYELGTLTVTDRNGNEIEVTHEGGSEYSFRMPNGRVTIEATFVLSSGGTGLPFTDVSTGDWYYEAVRYVYENGLMNGTTETTFAPNATTTRGMIVTILYRLEGEPAVSGGSFTDVAAGAYYADAIAWAAANGIVTGYGDGRFGPNDTITREQMATILYRYAAYKGYSVTSSGSLSGYGDAAQVSAYAEEAMAWANGANLVTGTTATTLSPRGSATRAQVATILMRFAGSFAR